MDHDHQFTVGSARAASVRGDLDEWVAAFLASPGSDNPVLGERLKQHRHWWLGPVELPLHRLHRLAGPPDAPVLCAVDDDFWGDDVDAMEEKVERGWEPPPVVVTYRDGQLLLEDGNHRVESLRRAGVAGTWAVVGFERREDRDAFTLPDDAAPDDRAGAQTPSSGGTP